MGLEPGQSHPGWQVLLLLKRCGLVHRLGLPRQTDLREDLVAQTGMATTAQSTAA